MSETAVATPVRLTMGTPIPEWLLVAEPAQAGAPRGNFRFAVDVDVVETPNYYLVMPIVPPGSQFPGIIDNSGMFGHRCYAPGKPVVTINLATTWFPVEVQAWNPNPDLPPAPLPGAPGYVWPELPYPTLRSMREPGLLRRVWRAIWTGR